MAEGQKGKFFAVNRHQWAKACELGMNPAIAYLVIACGSDKGNKISKWSANAVEKYTSISRRRSQAAVQALIENEFLEVKTKGKKGTNPKYEILRPKDEKPETDLIWLPNEIVVGAAQETPPIELLRQSGDPMRLRLLIDLYGEHDLTEDGGVGRNTYFSKYEREEIVKASEFVIYGFHFKHESCYPRTRLVKPHVVQVTEEEQQAGKNESHVFFERIQTLRELGLVSFVPMLMETDADGDGEVIHPLDEDMRMLAGQAAFAVAPDYKHINMEGYAYLVPVIKHMRQAAVVGILRLRYRPKTSKTSAWFATEQTVLEHYKEVYNEMIQRRTARRTTGMGFSF